MTYDDHVLRGNVKRLPDQVHALVTAAVDRGAQEGVAYMKINAPWHDRTGNARAGLNTVATHAGKVHTVVMAHGVPYGIWLEVRYAGRYSIIPRSILWTGDRIMETIDGGLGRL